MRIMPFSSEYSVGVRLFVIGVLSDEGFSYDPQKDSDLDDIRGNYIGNGGAFFISFENGGIVGTSAVRNLGSDACEIKRLYVKKEWRGMGLGLALFRSALDFAEQNYSIIRLKTDRSLQKAISMYQKHGFAVVKEEDWTVYFERSI